MKIKVCLLLVMVAWMQPVLAQQFYLNIRAAVTGDEGLIEEEHLFESIFQDTFLVSATRTLPPPVGTVTVTSESSASLITGELNVRNDCPDVPDACNGDAAWTDTLTFDATAVPVGQQIPLSVTIDVTGYYGATQGTGYTVLAESTAASAVVDTLRANVGYWNPTLTETNNPDGFQEFQRDGTWFLFGPDRFEGQLMLVGGEVNTVHLETSLSGSADMDITTDILLLASLPFTSASGVFLVPDYDLDGVVNQLDNCPNHANPEQTDSDDDGYGNRCDPDLNNDETVNFLDLQIMSDVFFTDDADADLDSDGFVNFLDLQIMEDFFFSSPGR